MHHFLRATAGRKSARVYISQCLLCRRVAHALFAFDLFPLARALPLYLQRRPERPRATPVQLMPSLSLSFSPRRCRLYFYSRPGGELFLAAPPRDSTTIYNMHNGKRPVRLFAGRRQQRQPRLGLVRTLSLSLSSFFTSIRPICCASAARSNDALTLIRSLLFLTSVSLIIAPAGIIVS